ncbi:glycosyltransferase family 2 protein [candidate division WOR-3 bacterium]|nr:glycosyltransferase family 2 protein [candidate division WOR-3 bacterium]
MGYPKVTIIIVNWNGKDNTLECLQSLREINYPNYEVIVVDNGSVNGSPEVISKKFLHHKLIALKRNIGYGSACNVAIKEAINDNTHYVYLSNNDIVFDKYFLTELVNVAEKEKEIGIVGPIVYIHSNPQKIQLFGGYLNLRTGEVSLIGHRQSDTGQFERVREVDFVMGGALLIKRGVIEDIGYFDPDYFMYGEEVDYEYRAKKAGYKLVAVSTAKVWHKVYGSFDGRLTPFTEFYIMRNKVYFMRKYFSGMRIIYFFLYLLFINLPYRIGGYLRHRHYELLLSCLYGVYRGFIDNIHKLRCE